MRKLAIIAGMLVLLALVPAPAVWADDDDSPSGQIQCITSLGPITVVTGLIVPAGRVCDLNRTIVRGSVTILAGGELRADGAKILGSIVGDGAKAVVLTCHSNAAGGCKANRNFVLGNIYLDDTASNPGSYTGNRNLICDSDVVGYIKVEDSSTQSPFDIGEGPWPTGRCESKNQVGGNIEVKDNRGNMRVGNNLVYRDVRAIDNTGGVLIRGNRILDDLFCDDNVPAAVATSNAVSDDNNC